MARVREISTRREVASVPLESAASDQRRSAVEVGTSQQDSERRAGQGVHGIVIGVLAECESAGAVAVEFRLRAVDYRVRVRALVSIAASDIGRQVALLFENGELAKPVLVGFVEPDQSPSPGANGFSAGTVTGERLVLTAQEEIVLQCGAASLTLTRAGKVFIQGANVLSRASGVNRIRGGSVQIN
ncbi:MAG: DUF6484 domain-containing protein [Planctomycetota bacterium]